jgi:hypothetical protein
MTIEAFAEMLFPVRLDSYGDPEPVLPALVDADAMLSSIDSHARGAVIPNCPHG